MSIDLTEKKQLLFFLKEHGLWAKKGLGQNFLVDRNALEKIVDAAEIEKDDLVIEVGPGVGTLTGELVEKAGEVVAVEMDEKLAELLAKQYSCHSRGGGNPEKAQANQLPGSRISSLQSGMTVCDGLKVVTADILKLNLNEVIGNKPYKVVANIPYYITSKIIELFLSRENKPEVMVLLVQKEVAERICAKPGAMSVLSVSVQLYGQPEMVSIVPKESFFPSPKVDSAILRIRIMNQESGIMDKDHERKFFRLVHIGFAARRKTLLNNLMVGYHLPREKVIDILNKMGLKESVRAQELSVEEWKELAENISQLPAMPAGRQVSSSH